MPRRGEQHHNATLPDWAVRRMRELYHTGLWGYESLARMYRCGVSTVRDICTYRTRML